MTQGMYSFWSKGCVRSNVMMSKLQGHMYYTQTTKGSATLMQRVVRVTSGDSAHTEFK